MQIVENVALISINATLWVQLGTFLLFMVLLNRIMIRPLRKIRAERQQYLEKIAQEVATADRRYQEISRQIHAQEKAARDAALDIEFELIHAGQRKAEEVMEQTRQRIAVFREDAHNAMARQIAVAREQIHGEAQTLAEKMVTVLLGRRGD